MAVTGKLTALDVQRATKRGYYGDGGGLWLQISAADTKSWVFRYSMNGKAREMGLGAFPDMELSAARDAALEARRLRQRGIDPIEHRKAERVRVALEAAKAITFKAAAKAYIRDHKAGWRNKKHREQWVATLKKYAYPVVGSLPVSVVDTALVVKVLQPIWATKTETASRVRGRIQAVLDWATARGYRSGDNPARWRGHLDKLLPTRSKVRRTRHHPALPYDELPAFVRALRQQPGLAARALEFLILTAARTGEVIGACERERKGNLWTVPAERIKGSREHRVPLSAAAFELLGAGSDDPDAYLFAGGRPGKPLSNMAMLKLLERMQEQRPGGWRDAKGKEITVHGFRSTFRDWAAERTNFPAAVAEMALAHAVEDETEAAYRRGDLFQKRRHLMDAWARYCTTSQSADRDNVVSVGARAAG